MGGGGGGRGGRLVGGGGGRLGVWVLWMPLRMSFQGFKHVPAERHVRSQISSCRRGVWFSGGTCLLRSADA